MTATHYFTQHGRSPLAKPIYLSLNTRATLSRFTGVPILEEYNEHYHYWATLRDLTRQEVSSYMPGYEGNMAKTRAA